ncbi:hypothetical protein D3C77_667690 [compost metagenome]
MRRYTSVRNRHCHPARTNFIGGFRRFNGISFVTRTTDINPQMNAQARAVGQGLKSHARNAACNAMHCLLRSY